MSEAKVYTIHLKDMLTMDEPITAKFRITGDVETNQDVNAWIERVIRSNPDKSFTIDFMPA